MRHQVAVQSMVHVAFITACRHVLLHADGPHACCMHSPFKEQICVRALYVSKSLANQTGQDGSRFTSTALSGSALPVQCTTLLSLHAPISLFYWEIIVI